MTRTGWHVRGAGRWVLCWLAALSLFAAAPVQAQSRNCTQITNLLRGIDTNRAFIAYQSSASELQAAEARVRDAESQFVRGGCQHALNQRQALSGPCRALAQTITSGRSSVQHLTGVARDGEALARHREALLQDYARFNCGAGGASGVTLSRQQAQPQDRRGALMDDVFGTGPQGGFEPIDTGFDPWTTHVTRRTVCVRTCDGFYWPISFSTTDAYINQDAIRCHEMCPAAEVLLFSYRNPGEGPEDMISLSGMPYRSTPYAFRFRQEVDMECRCQTREPTGLVAMAATSLNQSRAVIDFGETRFPLPRTDPRRMAEAVATDAVAVPLPRPRPRFEGEAPLTATRAQTPAHPDLNIVHFGDRPVRIVGPQTPFVPGAEEAS